MAYKYREEIVGKRFLCVSSPGKLKLAKISEWEWRSGVVRAVSGKDTNNVELSVLVEFDGKSWEKREWIKIYEIYQIFLVEYTVVLVPREVQNKSPYQVKWPALNFKPLVDKVGISTSRRKPLECFVDRELVIIDEKEIIYYKEGDEDSTALSREYTDLKKAVKNWVDYQDGQKILLTTPTVLVGYRVEVYRAEGTTQWYTAVIKAYNHTSKTLAVTDDTVLEAHNEDPALVQMRLIDDGVVDSILRGVEVGITSRRRPRNNTKDNDSKLTLHNTRQPNPNPFQCVPNNSKLPGLRKTRQRHTSCRSNNPDPENTDCDVPSTRSKTITREKKRKISAVIEEKRYLKNAIKIPTIDENHSSVLLVNKLKSSSQSSGTSRETSKSNKSSATKAKQIKLKSKRRHKGKVEKNKDVSNETTAAPVADIRNNLRSRSQTDSSFSPSSSLHENTHTASLDEKLATPVQNEETKAKGCLDKAIKREFSTILTDKQLEKLCIRNSTVSIKVKKLEDFPAEKLSISLRDKKDAQTINETTECMERNIISSIKKEILKDVSVRNTKLKHCKKEEEKQVGEEKVVEKEEEKEIKAKKKIDKKNKGEKEEVKDIEKGSHNSLKDKNTFSDKELNSESSYSYKEKNFPDNGVNTILEQSILAGIQDNMHFKKQFLLSGNNNNNNSNSNSNSNNTEKKSLQPVPEEAQKSLSANIDLNRPVTDQITKLTKTESSSQNGNDDSSPCPSPSKKEIESLSTKGKKETTSKSLDLSNEKCLSSSKKPPTVIEKMDYSTPGLTSDRSGAQPERSRVEEMKNPKYSPASSPLIIDKHEPVHPYRDPELMRKNPVHSMLTPHKSMTQPSYPNVPTALPAGHGTLAASSQLPSHQLPRTLMPQVPFSPHQIPSLNSLPSGHLPLPHAATIGQIEAARGLSAPAIGAITSQQQQQQQQQQQPPPPSHLAALQYPNAHLPILSSYGPIHGGLNSAQLEVLWQQQKFSAVANPQSYILTTHQEDLMREASLLHERELDRERLERLEKERRERRLEQERLERERQEKELAEREKMERERLERDKLEKERHLREERDLQERQERQRVFVKTQEVTPAAAAVNQHFIESLKRASQRSSTTTTTTTTVWPSPSITLGTGKGLVGKNELIPHSTKSNVFSHNVSHQDSLRPENKIVDKMEKYKYDKDDKHDGSLLNAQRSVYLDKHRDLSFHQKYSKEQDRLLQQSHTNQILYDGHIKMIEHGENLKSESVLKDEKLAKSQAYSHSDSLASSHPRANLVQQVQMKQEPNFSLYGYQPYQHSYISSDQLTLRGLTDKNNSRNDRSHEASNLLHRESSPSLKRKDLSVPPPLIKDGKHHNSVIVENKCRDGAKSASPHSSLYGSPAAPSSKSMSPTTPLSYSERLPERSLAFSTSTPNTVSYGSNHTSSPSPRHVPSAHSLSTFIMADKSRSQSPLQVASPQQLSAAVIQQPIDYRKTPPTSQRGLSNSTVNSHYNSSSAHISTSPYACNSQVISCSAHSITVSSPHMSQASQPQISGMVHSYMVPTHSLVTSSAESHLHGVPVSHANVIPPKTTFSPLTNPHTTTYTTNSTPLPLSMKRKPVRDSNIKKKMKPDQVTKIVTSTSVSVPVTTPQILSNPSPYTTSNSSGTTFQPTVSIPATLSATTIGSSLMLPTARASGYMDSFRSFVENTVQNAFFQDTTDVIPSTQKLQSKITETERQVPSNKVTLPAVANSQRNKDCTSIVPPLLPPPVSHSLNTTTTMTTTTSSTMATSHGCNSNITPTTSISVVTSHSGTVTSMVNYSEISCRSLNGQIDTDSDTLSAPSPPPPVKPETCSSPGRSSNHPKLKKAWLQRHSDEDRIKELKPVKEEEEDPNNLADNNNKEDVVKTCYVNCSYISPSKEGGSKSSISSIRMANGNLKELTKDSDESTSSASETDVQHEDENPSVKRHRQEVHIEEIEAKKLKPEPNSICDEEPKYISKKKTASGKAKAECQRSKISVCQVKQEESDNCPDLDYKDETMDTDNISQDSEVGYKTDIPMFKEDRISVNAFRHPPPKASVSTLKRTGEPFLQDGACRDVTPKLMKCRECRLTPNQRSKKLPNIFCRFYEFRKLRYSQKGFLMIAGFAELSDAYKEDIKPWDPELPVNDPQIDEKMSKYILSKVGDKFCELVEQEREARSWAGKDAKIAWKRAVTGVREMCDVCDTTLFNIHWVCHKCGFVACLDCYKARMNRSNSDNDENDETASSPEEHEWLTCSSNRQAHEPDRLMLTQIIPSNALWDLGRRIHELRKNFNIPSNCSCDRDVVQKNGVKQELIQHAVNHASSDKPKLNGLEEENKKSGGGHGTQTENLSNYNPDANSPLCLLADVAMNSENSRDRTDPLLNKKDDESNNAGNQESLPTSSASEGGEKKAAGCSTLRELLTKTAGKVKPGADSKKASKPKTVRDTLADIIQSVVGKAFPKENETVPMMKLMHYIPRMGPRIIAREIPISKHTLTETSVLYPDVPHSWLCDGRLLRLHEPKHKNNILIFQEQWKQGSPVIVSGVQKYLKKRIWQPESFGEEFGHLENDLVNCRTGDVWIGHPMKIFWEGFENIKKRLKDKNNDPMLLKLKDWPPGDDFSDLLPHRFTDLMQALPLPDYTRRAGILNLASRLPDFLVRPDLGPKMYNAYGSASFPSEGTTNLHLDVSDAVNIMVHVGIPDDGPNGRHEHIEEALKAIDDADCDIITKRRVREVNEIPGALWHIYCAEEADKIRDLLNKVGKENGQKIEPDHDPIHDQSWYLDAKLRDRLNKEYGVLGYTIVQCLGDAVFIPAGAPHQVRNLHSCVKVAEDFVSPEHLDHCFRMTQEFRHLSDTHSNHEDKLQVKNIIYHAVKDAIAVLSNASPE